MENICVTWKMLLNPCVKKKYFRKNSFILGDRNQRKALYNMWQWLYYNCYKSHLENSYTLFKNILQEVSLMHLELNMIIISVVDSSLRQKSKFYIKYNREKCMLSLGAIDISKFSIFWRLIMSKYQVDFKFLNWIYILVS